jgi:hypothetical protein
MAASAIAGAHLECARGSQPPAHATGGYGYAQIAQQFGVHFTTVVKDAGIKGE